MKYLISFLTIFRIISSPVILIISLFFDSYFFALVLFIVASITDYLDGMLARKYKLESVFGAVLDPIADKILLVFALITITISLNNPYVAIMSSVILSREFLVTGLREYSAINNHQVSLKVSSLAKAKTTIQFISIALFLLGLSSRNALLLFIATFVLFLAVLITLKTGLEYSSRFFKAP